MSLESRLQSFISAVGADIKSLSSTKQRARNVGSATSVATLTVDVGTYDGYKLTAQAAALTVAAPSGSPVAMQPLLLRIKDNGTAQTLTWNSVFRAIGVTLPTTTAVNKTLYVMSVWNSDATKWDVLGVSQEA